MVLMHVGIPKDMGKTKLAFIPTLYLSFEIDNPLFPALQTLRTAVLQKRNSSVVTARSLSFAGGAG